MGEEGGVDVVHATAVAAAVVMEEAVDVVQTMAVAAAVVMVVVGMVVLVVVQEPRGN